MKPLSECGGHILLALAFLSGWTCTTTAAPAAHCFVTAEQTLEVCHSALEEHVLLAPTRIQTAYNVQLVDDGGQAIVAVLHSEAYDLRSYFAATHRLRPGDSIKTGVLRYPHSLADYTLPPGDLHYRIWGTNKNAKSPLYYGFDASDPDKPGVSGGGNPIVVAGNSANSDRVYYVFFLAVVSDAGTHNRWRNALLEARTSDFRSFDLMEHDSDGRTVWKRFSGDTSSPAIVTDSDHRPIVSGAPAISERVRSGSNRVAINRPITTQGLFGSIVKLPEGYYFFYTDYDRQSLTRNGLFVRHANDISVDSAWSAPTHLLDVPAEMLIRVAKASGMARWVVAYNCTHADGPSVSDVCLQYSANLDLTGKGSLASLRLFQSGNSDRKASAYSLGLIGGNLPGSATFLKAQQDFLTDRDGNLSSPPGTSGDTVGGMVTWSDFPTTMNVFGAKVYCGLWTVRELR
jgi:hypothetical protein